MNSTVIDDIPALSHQEEKVVEYLKAILGIIAAVTVPRLSGIRELVEKRFCEINMMQE